MIKHRLRGLSTILGNQVEPEKIEELKRNKTDIENNLSKILKIIKNEDQGSNRDRSPKGAGQETELVGLIEDFFTQYQSLYALYDRLTAENGKIVSRRIDSGVSASLSCSSSDSDYFSSDEVETRRNSPEREHHITIPDPRCEAEDNESESDLHARAISTRGKELEEQFHSQKKDIESLTCHKSELQLQIAKNAGLQTLENTKEDQVSGLQRKLDDYDQSHDNITELIEQINTLTTEAKTLRDQKDEVQAKLTPSRDEALSQMEGLRDQLNVMRQNLESLSDKNEELATQMEYLNQQIVEKGLLERRMQEENEGLAGRVKELEMELESRCKEKEKLEEELRQKNNEIKQMRDENKSLEDRNLELKRAVTHAGEELKAQAKERESSSRNGASPHAIALSSQFNDLKLELNYYKEEKIRLELQNERIQKEYSESLATVFDQGRTIKDQTETIERISAEIEESRMWARKFKLNKQFSEKRIEELAEEIRRQLEDSIRLLYRRIRVAEQLHNENKDGYKVVKERYEQENKMLKQKVAIYEEKVAGFGATKLKPIEVLNVLELATSKLEDAQVSFHGRVAQMMEEVQNARDWIKQRKKEMKQLKTNVEDLSGLLNDKEEQELLLREKVEKLETRLREEGEENLNLMKSVTELEKKVGMLEKSLKEKDEELVNLGDTKREAIRQLCFLNDYHRNRCDVLKGLIAKKNTSTRT
ncbi:COP1-interactive protein 1-like [Neltuma alba]|uniref:COP1-interactive protein 1-like n=1 Tax=Neltuma alba TaxID=207710 RepID=UPI0010A34E65|nr:COP1-interactive protein 1-like [Prosopis alba]